MDYKNAYYHMLSQIAGLITMLEYGQVNGEQINVPTALKSIQSEGKKFCANDMRLSFKAPRHN